MEPGKPPEARISAVFCAASRYVRLPFAPSMDPMMGAKVFASWKTSLMPVIFSWAGPTSFCSFSMWKAGSEVSSSVQRCMAGAPFWMAPSSVVMAAMFSLPSASMQADGGVVDRLLVSGTMALSDASARADAMVCTPLTSLPTTGSMAATFQTGEESSSFMAFAEDCRLEAFFAAVAKSCPAMAV